MLRSKPNELAHVGFDQLPGDATKLTRLSLVHKLTSDDDLRFDLTWLHGAFLIDLPRRLGYSKALDAATEALMHAMTYSYVRRQSSTMIRSYANALEAVRADLHNPCEASSSNTMCAIYLLWLCQASQTCTGSFSTYLHILQGWAGFAEDSSIHAEGVAHVINSGLDFDRLDDFGRGVLVTLCSVVVSDRNPKLVPWLHVIASRLELTRD